MNATVGRFAETLRANIRRNFAFYLVVFFMFVVGIMAGVNSGARLPSGARWALTRYVAGVYDASGGAFSLSSIFFQSIFSHVAFLALIAICGFSALLIPISLLALTFRGFLLGFAAAALVNLAGLAGILTMLLCVLFPALPIAPCYLYTAAEAMRAGIDALKDRNPAKTKTFLSKAANAFFIALIGVALETLLVPIWLKLVAGAI